MLTASMKLRSTCYADELINTSSEQRKLAIASMLSGLNNHYLLFYRTRLTTLLLFSIFLLYHMEFSRLLSTLKLIFLFLT